MGIGTKVGIGIGPSLGGDGKPKTANQQIKQGTPKPGISLPAKGTP